MTDEDGNGEYNYTLVVSLLKAPRYQKSKELAIHAQSKPSPKTKDAEETEILRRVPTDAVLVHRAVAKEVSGHRRKTLVKQGDTQLKLIGALQVDLPKGGVWAEIEVSVESSGPFKVSSGDVHRQLVRLSANSR